MITQFMSRAAQFTISLHIATGVFILAVSYNTTFRSVEEQADQLSSTRLQVPNFASYLAQFLSMSSNAGLGLVVLIIVLLAIKVEALLKVPLVIHVLEGQLIQLVKLHGWLSPSGQGSIAGQDFIHICLQHLLSEIHILDVSKS